MIVVADTSVILNLCRVQQERLLQQLFQGVLILIDETLGRRVAEEMGLRTVGILGVLIQARRREMIPGLKGVLDRLETEAGFWLSQGLRAKVLQTVGE